MNNLICNHIVKRAHFVFCVSSLSKPLRRFSFGLCCTFFFILQLTMHSSSICEVTLYPFFQKKLHKIIVTCLIYEYFFFKIQDMCSVVLFYRNPTQTTVFVTLLKECFSELGNYIEESCDRIVEIWLGDGNAFWIIVKHH